MKTRPLSLSSSLSVAVVLSLASVAVTGCNPAGAGLDAKTAHDTGKGTSSEYDATFDQAWAAAHAAIAWNQVGAPQDHVDEHYIITDAARYDQIGIWVIPESATRTKVTVVVIDDPVLPGPNEEGVMKDIAKAIELVKAGQPTDKRPK